jgi:hypothetical protein
MAGLSRFPNRLARSYLHSRDGRIRTGDPLNPIQKVARYALGTHFRRRSSAEEGASASDGENG